MYARCPKSWSGNLSQSKTRQKSEPNPPTSSKKALNKTKSNPNSQIKTIKHSKARILSTLTKTTALYVHSDQCDRSQTRSIIKVIRITNKTTSRPKRKKRRCIWALRFISRRWWSRLRSARIRRAGRVWGRCWWSVECSEWRIRRLNRRWR